MNKLITGLLIFMCMTLAAQTNRSYPPPKVSDNLLYGKISLSDFGLKGMVKKYSGVDWLLSGYSPYGFEWSFNEKGQLISQYISNRFDSEQGFRYDVAGYLIESYDMMGSDYILKYVYDSFGYISTIIESYDGQNIDSKTEFSYQDTTYTKTSVSEYSRNTVKYNSQGKPVSSTSYSDTGFLCGKTDYEYIPSEGITIIHDGWDKDRHTGKIIEKRNPLGQLIETTTYNSTGETCDYHSYTYDAEGRCVSDKGKNSMIDPIYTTTYKYVTDEMGNVIKVIFQGEYEPIELTWEIEYY